VSMTDPIGDMLTMIRNACSAKHGKVDIPASNLKREIVRILMEEGFIKNYAYIEDNRQGILRLYLKYGSKGESIIKGLRRISRPGRRRYVKKDEIPRVLNGLGIAIISTSKGVFPDRDARRIGVGGEVLCYVW